MANKSLSFALAVAVASLGASACTNTLSPGSTSTPTSDPPAGVTLDQASTPRDPASPTALGAAVTANNAFALSLYAQVAPTAAGNVITSPLSASFALTMAYAGAQGQTATEMASALQLQGSAASIFGGQNALSQALNGRAAAAAAAAAAQGTGSSPLPASAYVLDVVNSLWGQKTYPWAAPFLDVLAESYGAGIYLEDFTVDSGAATNAINSWVSNETGDQINNLLPAGWIDASTRLVLVNAVELKLPWANPFPVEGTWTSKFTRADGTQVSASFMNQLFDGTAGASDGPSCGYAETDGAQVVSIPLAGNELSVVLALPKNGLANLVSSLTPATWAAMTSTTSRAVSLSVPKFNFTSPSVSLKAALQALGMKSAFDPATADFAGLCATTPDGENLYIGDVLQEATIAADENGVSAAAATAVGLDAATDPMAVTLTLDNPFLVSIVDSSGAILFLGQVSDPTSTGGQ